MAIGEKIGADSLTIAKVKYCCIVPGFASYQQSFKLLLRYAPDDPLRSASEILQRILRPD
jgi:hypothetical protein